VAILVFTKWAYWFGNGKLAPLIVPSMLGRLQKLLNLS
jgi:hypothetical protein